MRYRCLILDHDDTAVDSTSTIHHPAHVESMRILRPGFRAIDLDGWFLKNFDPGIGHYLRSELAMSDVELASEMKIWRRFTATRTPQFYPGFLDALADFEARGGTVTVASHSESNVIRSHYESSGARLTLHAVYGWEMGESRRKPNPWPVHEVMRQFDLKPDEVLVVDDLKPGVVMSQLAGVPVAAAGWSHRLAPIETFMRANCVEYFESVAQFHAFIVS